MTTTAAASPRTARFATVTAAVLSMLIVGALAGCSQTTHNEAKAQAQQRWDRIRAGVKLQLAEQHFRAGRMKNCLQEAGQAVALDPQSIAPRILLTQALIETGQLLSAAAAIDAAAAIEPEHPEVLYMQGVVAERRQDLERALTCYQRASERDPTQADYVASEVECLVAIGRPWLAQEVLQDRSADFPQDATLKALQAEVALLLGDEHTALQGLQAALRNAGNDPRLTEEYGLLLVRTGQHERAVSVLEPMYARSPDSMSRLSVRTLASAYLALGRPQQAKNLLSRLVEKYANDPHDWTILARAAMVCNDWATARRCAETLVGLTPDDPDTQFLMGYVCWKLNDPQRAKAALRSVLITNPSDAMAHCILGDVYRQTADFPNAQRHFQSAIQFDPTCEWARDALAELKAS
ncbi:MAG: tetratricopeptide repeat protein [Phycisphaerae bacterium]|nr:tetratricopeptide repeat protein [Phycisphaerae bacterium]